MYSLNRKVLKSKAESEGMENKDKKIWVRALPWHRNRKNP